MHLVPWCSQHGHNIHVQVYCAQICDRPTFLLWLLCPASRVCSWAWCKMCRDQHTHHHNNACTALEPCLPDIFHVAKTDTLLQILDIRAAQIPYCHCPSIANMPNLRFVTSMTLTCRQSNNLQNPRYDTQVSNMESLPFLESVGELYVLPGLMDDSRYWSFISLSWFHHGACIFFTHSLQFYSFDRERFIVPLFAMRPVLIVLLIHEIPLQWRVKEEDQEYSQTR